MSALLAQERLGQEDWEIMATGGYTVSSVPAQATGDRLSKHKQVVEAGDPKPRAILGYTVRLLSK